MTTINVSKEAYRLILKRKQFMEETQQELVSIARVLDTLIGVGPLLGVDEAEEANKR